MRALFSSGTDEGFAQEEQGNETSYKLQPVVAVVDGYKHCNVADSGHYDYGGNLIHSSLQIQKM